MLVKVAGKTKGENSTAFLERLLLQQDTGTAGVVDALWQKKAATSVDAQRLVRKWLKLKLDQGLLKASYYLHLATHDFVKPLQDAIGSEIHQDIQVTIKGLALLYDRPQIERVMELYNLADQAKVYNAIEMLELIVPRKYFNPLNTLVELEQDITRNQLLHHHSKEMSVNDIIADILQDKKACFNSWTKSVACYMIPRLQPHGVPDYLLDTEVGKEDYLMQETRHYVVSMLN
jgi:hypothetical protein